MGKNDSNPQEQKGDEQDAGKTNWGAEYNQRKTTNTGSVTSQKTDYKQEITF